MAVAFASVGTVASTGAAGALTPVIPASSSGDALIAICGAKVAGTTVSTPAGWTAIFNDNTTALWNTKICYKLATGSDANPAFTFTSAMAYAVVARFTGTSAAVLGTNGGVTSANSATHTSASFNSTASNSLAVAFDFQATNTVQSTTPTGWTSASAVVDSTAAASLAIWTLALVGSGSASGAISVAEASTRYSQIQIELLVAVAADILYPQACL